MLNTQKDKIRALLTDLKKDSSIPQFCYNLNQSKTVCYGGPLFDDEELVEAIHTLLFGKWFVSGENVDKFEKEFSKYINMKYSLMVNSGSSANLIILEVMKKFYEWKTGDEVIVSSVGFPTTVAPILQVGLKPVFCDIELETLNFNINEIEKKITPFTRAIVVSPVLGNPPDMTWLKSLCDKHFIHIIMDGCDSLGSKWNGKHLAEYGVMSSCSFYPAHHITTGEGGMVSTNSEELIRLARSFAWWGRGCHCVGPANLSKAGSCGKRFSRWLPQLNFLTDHRYLYTNIGYNLKPLDLQGSIGLVQLKKMEYIHAKRVEYKNRIQNILSKVKGLSFPRQFFSADVSWFGVPIICNSARLKEHLVKYLEDNRIQTRNYFAGNLLLHPAYKDLDDWKKYPNANTVLERIFFIGCSPTMTEENITYIDEVISKYE
jgi:CDP-6-deoxy-D-xylo-4-hexulose-3-dehydrase